MKSRRKKKGKGWRYRWAWKKRIRRKRQKASPMIRREGTIRHRRDSKYVWRKRKDPQARRKKSKYHQSTNYKTSHSPKTTNPSSI